jgi:hypothetical protein
MAEETAVKDAPAPKTLKEHLEASGRPLHSPATLADLIDAAAFKPAHERKGKADDAAAAPADDAAPAPAKKKARKR